MQQNRGGATEENGGPSKRLRRPNVRLNQYVNPNHSKLQQKWDDFKKDLEGAKRVRKTRTKMNVVDETDFEDDDDDMVLGNWKNRNGSIRGRVLKSTEKRKVGKPTNRSKKWRGGKDQEKEEFSNSSVGESEKEGESGKKGEGGENLRGNRVNRNFGPETSDSSSQSPSLPSERMSDDYNLGGKQGMRGMELTTRQDSDEIKATGDQCNRDKPDGIKMWLNQLGLGKYASLFKVHEVDDEVLPFLTLEDLKDMGISAVGPRRKMFRSIQKLGKRFS